MTADIIDDEDAPRDPLTPSQRAHFNATFLRLDNALGEVSPETRALARGIVEVVLYAGIHDTNSVVQRIITSREETLEDIKAPLKTIDDGLSVANQIADRNMGQIESLTTIANAQSQQITTLARVVAAQGEQITTLTQHVGEVPADDPRSIVTRLDDVSQLIGAPPSNDPRPIMERLANGEVDRKRHGRAIHAIFALIAIALFLGLLAIAISVLLPPPIAAAISGSSVTGAVVVGLRILQG